MRTDMLFAEPSARFLNVHRRLQRPHGWNDPTVEKLWLYNLHYFEGLLVPPDESRQAHLADWVQWWIEDNPAPVGTGWEPYPLSLRIANWIKWTLNGAVPRPQMLQSLAVQARYLTQRLEHHLLGNHLFENAKALMMAGLFYTGPEADRWYSLGRQIMDEQLGEQLLDDGGHFERSPMYQALLLEGLLDLHNLQQAADPGAGTTPWAVPAQRMLDWLRRLCHPDGGIAFFNDAAFGIAPSLGELAAYASRLELDETPAAKTSPPGDWLGASGYARLERPGLVLLADVAPVGPDYLPGHAHADSLSFECSIRGQRVLVNGGTSTYLAGAERQRQRGTAAHNTVSIDGQDSSEVWAAFRVARRARTRVERFEIGSTVTSLAASHDGYRRLPGQPVHRRDWLLGTTSLDIQDEVRSARVHRIVTYYHFHPVVTPRRVQAGFWEIVGQQGEVIATLELDQSLSWQVVAQTWHPGFGLSAPSFGLTGSIDGVSDHRWRTTIRWNA